MKESRQLKTNREQSHISFLPANFPFFEVFFFFLEIVFEMCQVI